MSNFLSLSYVKDSMACLEACKILGIKIDSIRTSEIMFDENISADSKEMLEFKVYVDKVIKERYGLDVEHIKPKHTYKEIFYREVTRPSAIKVREEKFISEKIYGFPKINGGWCVSNLKISAINYDKSVPILGIAFDERQRIEGYKDKCIFPLIELKWTEEDCYKWCEENNLLSPIYKKKKRGGCWFCHKQNIAQLRILYFSEREKYNMLMDMEKISPTTFRSDGHTLEEFAQRFEIEKNLNLDITKNFKWKLLEEYKKSVE